MAIRCAACSPEDGHEVQASSPDGHPPTAPRPTVPSPGGAPVQPPVPGPSPKATTGRPIVRHPPVDPMRGFPPGTPSGLPVSVSWHAQLHNLAFLFTFLGLMVAQFFFARHFASAKQTGVALCGLATGVTTPTLILISLMVPAFSPRITIPTPQRTSCLIGFRSRKPHPFHRKPAVCSDHSPTRASTMCSRRSSTRGTVFAIRSTPSSINWMTPPGTFASRVMVM